MSLAELDSYIEQIRGDWKNVGVAVAVVQGNEVLYARGFGVKEFGETAEVDSETLFQVGSTTKSFTTAALGILVEEGRVHWDDLVADLLPGLQLKDPWLTRRLTIRDLVTHRSGISDTYYPFVRIMDADETIRELCYVTPEAEFRSSYVYSNLMYAAAGRVVEVVSGITWHDFVQQRLMEPLKMNRSGTSPYEFWDAQYVTPTFLGSAPAGRPGVKHARDANLAMPHSWDESGSIVVLPWQSYDNAAAAGAIVSSAAEMAKWLILHLNEGRFEGQQLLRPETVRELHAPQNACSNPFPFETMAGSYAMGWARTEYRGHTYLAHGGGIIGSPAYMTLLPDAGTGVVVLSNGPREVREEYALHKSIALWVFDRQLGATARDWSQEFLSRAQNMRDEEQREECELRRSRLPNAPTALPIDRYVGTYQDQYNRSGCVSVRAESGGLQLSFAGQGAYSARLEHWCGDRFRLRSSAAVDDVLGPAFALFAIDGSGSVVSMTVFGDTLQRLAVSDPRQGSSVYSVP